MQGFSLICFWRSIYGDLKSFPASKIRRKSKSVRNIKPTKIKTSYKERKNRQYSLTPNFPFDSTGNFHFLVLYFTLNTPTPVSTHLEQRWYLYVEESRRVRAEGEEVWAARDVVSEDSMFIPPWGEGCHCWIPVNEVWRPIPVSRVIHRYRSDVSNVDVTLPQ